MKYCTYLTVYKGNNLPPFYIGSSSIKIINSGYHGSVKSRRYKVIWKNEIIEHPELFSTKIISIHETRKQAFEKEYKLQKSLNVIKNPLYINQSLAASNSFFGMSKKGIKLTQLEKDKISERTKESIVNKKCEYCFRDIERGNYTRWHGEKCLKNPKNFGIKRTYSKSRNLKISKTIRRNGLNSGVFKKGHKFYKPYSKQVDK